MEGEHTNYNPICRLYKFQTSRRLFSVSMTTHLLQNCICTASVCSCECSKYRKFHNRVAKYGFVRKEKWFRRRNFDRIFSTVSDLHEY